MKTKLLSIILLFSTLLIFAQKLITGKVSASGTDLPNVTVINVTTDQKTFTDHKGNFSIEAKPSDEIRFTRQGYDRNTLKVSEETFHNNLQINLEPSTHLIEEVKIAFLPSGNLVKDVNALGKPRITEVNNSLSAYMKRPFSVAQPKLSTPSAFAPADFQAGQVDLVKLATAVSNIFGRGKNGPPTTANYVETQQFYRRIKEEVDLRFYTSKGWTEEDIDRFLIYADENYDLAKKYRKTFDVATISSEMKMAYYEYIKTHKVAL